MFRCLRIFLPSQVVRNSLHLSHTITQKHNPVLEKLLTEFTDLSYIAKAVNNDDLKDVPYKEWKNRITLLKQYGFEDCDCFKMISSYPALLKISETNLKSTLQQWFNAELGAKNFQLVLISHPHLLEVNDNVIRKRLPILRTYFRGVSALSQLIINSPNVMYEDWNNLNSKIHYLLNTKKFKMGDILKSCALSKDLDFIKLRFYVLEKCGVFKHNFLMPHEENKYKKSVNKNPKLKYIVQDKDENFAKLVAKISVEEYLAAKDLFADENADNFVSDEEEGENDDDDDDNE